MEIKIRNCRTENWERSLIKDINLNRISKYKIR